MKNFMSKPMTWGGYIKLLAICAGFGALCSLAWYVLVFTDRLDKLMLKFKK